MAWLGVVGLVSVREWLGPKSRRGGWEPVTLNDRGARRHTREIRDRIDEIVAAHPDDAAYRPEPIL